MRHWMKWFIALALTASVTVTTAGAAERAGKVQKVDRDQRTVTLDDGTVLWVVPGLSLDLLTPGKVVGLVYEERDGKKWLKSIEATK